MSFDPSRHNFAGLGGRPYQPAPPKLEPPLTSECCDAMISPQKVLFNGEVYDEGACDDCGSLVCMGCGGPLDSDAVAVE